MAHQWLNDAVFYQIYPQSFCDSNGDGIGDIQGIISKLDYLRDLGITGLWINPIYDSPFKDAGYDVRDYKKVASRYGALEDVTALFQAAHERGIRVLLDLVPGHTSEEHPWFLESAREQENEFSDRYIWTTDTFSGSDGLPFISGEFTKDSAYIINFFKCQPALNYGFRNADQSWKQAIDAPGPRATREAMKDVMRFWLDLGCDGFRVDMADSLVKQDGHDKLATMEVWKDIAGAIHREYPHAVLVSEWNNPQQALNCGFDMDFYLEWGGNGYSSLLRDYVLDRQHNIVSDRSYFKAESGRDMTRFVEDYLPRYEATRDKGLWCLITSNHDIKRTTATLNDRERRLAFAFLFTMPGAPFLYYGDEIGMRYRFLSSKEGGYHRTGSRTPMQWSSGKNLGFSQAEPQQLYLPVDPAADAPTVQQQLADSHSFLQHMMGLIRLRRSHEDLGSYSPLEIFSAEPGSRLFAYKRGKLLLAVNPGLEAQALQLDGAYKSIYQLGNAETDGKVLTLSPQSFAVLEPVT